MRLPTPFNSNSSSKLICLQSSFSDTLNVLLTSHFTLNHWTQSHLNSSLFVQPDCASLYISHKCMYSKNDSTWQLKISEQEENKMAQLVTNTNMIIHICPGCQSWSVITSFQCMILSRFTMFFITLFNYHIISLLWGNMVMTVISLYIMTAIKLHFCLATMSKHSGSPATQNTFKTNYSTNQQTQNLDTLFL